jgi:hypothetical protein
MVRRAFTIVAQAVSTQKQQGFGVTIAPPVSTGPTKLLPSPGLFLSPADPLLA